MYISLNMHRITNIVLLNQDVVQNILQSVMKSPETTNKKMIYCQSKTSIQ